MWFVFNTANGCTMNFTGTDPDSGKTVDGTLDFLDAATAALWAVRFMEGSDIAELEIVNTELGVTYKIAKQQTALPKVENGNNEGESTGAA